MADIATRGWKHEKFLLQVQLRLSTDDAVTWILL